MTQATVALGLSAPAITRHGWPKTSIKVEPLTCAIGAELINVHLGDAPIAALLRHGERNEGDCEVVSHRVEGDVHRCSRAELMARARRLANALAATGVVPGDSVATLAWNGHRQVELAFAACGSGAILHALDPHLHPDRIVRIVDDARVRLVFFDLSFMPLVEEIAPRLAAATTFIALTDRTNMPAPATISDLLCYEDVIAGAPDDFDWPDFDDETIAALCRMAARAEEQGSACSALPPALAAFVPDELNLLSQDIVLSAIPMSHVDSWRLVGAAWAADTPLVFAGPWLDGRSLYDLIDGEGVTVAAARPQVWQGLLAHIEREAAALPSLRLAIITGESACPAAIANTLHDRYGVTGPPRPDGDPLYGWGDARERSPLVSRVARGRAR
jgi:fatty-acyl-CoA synthase